MRYRCIWGTLLLCMTMAAHSQGLLDEPDQQVAVPAALDEVVVTGERAGPRLWRVSKDGHVLWLLGTPDSLPKEVTWQSQDVEAVISESQQVLTGMRAKASPGLFSLLPLYLQYRRAVKLPDSQTLKEWLSPESYRRYEALKERYAPQDDLDGYHPIYVAQQLWRSARESAGLNQRANVEAAVLKLANKHNVSVERKTLTVEQPAQTARTVLKELEQMPRAQEVACLEETMARLEADVTVIKARANAWALGDVASLRRLPATARSACWEALTSSARVKQLQQQIQDDWMNAALKSLEANQSTLGMHPIEELLSETGVLAQFRAAGYTVEGP